MAEYKGILNPVPKNRGGYYDYSNAGALIDFNQTRSHTATQDCLFSFYAIGQGSLNANITINNKTVIDAVYMYSAPSGFLISFPFCYPLKTGDVVKLNVNTGQITELRGHEIPLAN